MHPLIRFFFFLDILRFFVFNIVRAITINTIIWYFDFHYAFMLMLYNHLPVHVLAVGSLACY